MGRVWGCGWGGREFGALRGVQRDGCPQIINMGERRANAYFQGKKTGFAPRG